MLGDWASPSKSDGPPRQSARAEFPCRIAVRDRVQRPLGSTGADGSVLLRSSIALRLRSEHHPIRLAQTGLRHDPAFGILDPDLPINVAMPVPNANLLSSL